MLEGKNYYEKPDLQLLRAIGQLIKININSQCPFSQPSTTDPKLNTQVDKIGQRCGEETFLGILYTEPQRVVIPRHIAEALMYAVLCLVTQSYPILCDPMNCNLPGSTAHGVSPGKNTGMGCCFPLGVY